MSFDFEMLGRISCERLVSVDAKLYIRGWKGMSALTKWIDAPDQFTDYVCPRKAGTEELKM